MAHTSQTTIFMDEGDRPYVALHKGAVFAGLAGGIGCGPSAHWPSISEAEAWADDLLHQIVMLKAQVKDASESDEQYDLAVGA